MRNAILPALAAALMLASQASAAAKRSHVASHRGAGVSLRKRLNVNNLIAEPGSLEIDFAGLHSFTTSGSFLPTALRFSPEGNGWLAGRTEYSVAFDAVDSTLDPARNTRFSDRIALAATTVVFSRPQLAIAVSPQVTALRHGDSGLRAGATVIARLDRAGQSIGLGAGWTGATRPADGTNPAGVWDLGAGYGHALGAQGWRAHITPHANLVVERATGTGRTTALTAGLEYQITPHASFDVSAQRFGLTGGTPDRQLLVGLTVNLPFRR